MDEPMPVNCMECPFLRKKKFICRLGYTVSVGEWFSSSHCRLLAIVSSTDCRLLAIVRTDGITIREDYKALVKKELLAAAEKLN